jgi:hypothetical protein
MSIIQKVADSDFSFREKTSGIMELGYQKSFDKVSRYRPDDAIPECKNIMI